LNLTFVCKSEFDVGMGHFGNDQNGGAQQETAQLLPPLQRDIHILGHHFFVVQVLEPREIEELDRAHVVCTDSAEVELFARGLQPL